MLVGLQERNACLMANHGQIALGATLAEALELAFEVEVLAEQYYKLLALGGTPHILDDAEMRAQRREIQNVWAERPGQLSGAL